MKQADMQGICGRWEKRQGSRGRIKARAELLLFARVYPFGSDVGGCGGEQNPKGSELPVPG